MPGTDIDGDSSGLWDLPSGTVPEEEVILV